VAKLWEIISISKQARQKFDLERFDLRMLNDVEVRENYQVEISNRFAALENLDESLGRYWRKYQDLSKRNSRISQAKA
jgi:hypothetical protein